MLLSRRRFLQLGAASLATTACSDSVTTSLSRSPVAGTISPNRAADVLASYSAAPMEFDLAGTTVPTWGYNGTIPGPLLRARAGDLLEVELVNQLPTATSVHWHGLALVNSMDGVPGITQPDIEPGTSFTYRFIAPDPGTYWFHPHHGLQLDRGLYAPLIIDAADEDLDVDAEHILVLDDWLDGLGTTPEQELERIRLAAAEMGSMDHDMGDMGQMGGMSMATSSLLGGDAGDAVYPHHLLNGRPRTDPYTLDPMPRAGDRIRLRIINAGSDTAYRLAIGGHRLTVTHTDGFPVEPVTVDALLIGMGERYDVVVDVRSGAWPVIALAEGKDDRAVCVLRTIDSAATSTPNLDANPDELDGTWLRYSALRATERSRLVLPSETRRIDIELTGSMAPYEWGIDGRPFGNHEPIEVEADEWITLGITNTSTMWHPIHLHGHTPQLGTLPDGPRKDTVNVLPRQSVDLVFRASNPGEWMLHCHNTYHLESGMATTITYTA